MRKKNFLRNTLPGMLFLFGCMLLPSALFAKISLPEIFSDDMILQQQTHAPIWGKASPGKKVKIKTSWDGKEYETLSGQDGKWMLEVATPAAGGPYEISISDGKELKLKNVLIGEVWICSGQSNMEMPLAGWGKVLDYEQEIASADYSRIRLLSIEKQTAYRPSDDVKVTGNKWMVCVPSTIGEFSSTAYFFGRDLYENLNIPIGLIHTSWGGTIAEAWTSGETLEEMPYFRERVVEVKNLPQQITREEYDKDVQKWEAAIQERDKGLQGKEAVWAKIGLDDNDWGNMPFPGMWERTGLGDFDGILWVRKTVDIPAHWEGQDLVLKLGMIDDNDITYFNGIQVGTTDGHAEYRSYTVPASLVKKGKAVISIRITDTGGDGGINGEEKELVLIPSGQQEASPVSLAGEWKYKIGVDFKDHPAPLSPFTPNIPTVLYNAMIRPLVPFAIQGAIWYQGESNADRAYQYRELFPLLIRDWRKQWGKDFPFYFVQLANFMKTDANPQESNWAELREAQLQTLNLENTGMAVTIDIGEANDIHPKNKQDVGKRLALAARANTYKENILCSGPVYQSYKIEGNKIRISFRYAEGLKTPGNDKLTGFAIAGPDHVFHWAEAVIDGNEVVVSAPQVEFPVAVRYAWADNPVCNLYNRADLPASPFRTDDWRK